MSLQYQRSWVTLAPTDFEKSHQFYRQLFGKVADRTLFRDDRMIYAEFHLIGLNLGLYAPKAQYPETLSSSPMSLCFQVDDLEEAIGLVTKLGASVGEIMTPSHGREVYAFDPDGNRLILYQPY